MHNKKNKVVFYEPYPMGLGGNFLTQRLILERLDKSKFTPIVVSPIDGVALDMFREKGIECVVIPPPNSLTSYGGSILGKGFFSKIIAAFDLLRYNLKIFQFIREKKIDLVYANCVRAEMCVGLAARLASIPSLLYVKGELANPIIDRLCFFLAKKILFFCPQNRDDKYSLLVKCLKKKIGILKIGLDSRIIENAIKYEGEALKKELGIDSKFVNTAILAQLYRPKGQHFVVEAMGRLIKELPNLRLYLLGDHVIDEYLSYRNELQILIDKYNLSQNVIFTGWRKDALAIALQMDIIIHPSLAEGFGRAVLEAMALGKPVIASRVGGLREIIEDGKNGYLVEPGDVDTIVKRWRNLITDEKLRAKLGGEARKTVFSDYLIDDKVKKFADICLGLVEDRA